LSARSASFVSVMRMAPLRVSGRSAVAPHVGRADAVPLPVAARVTPKAAIVDYLKEHPGSTAGNVAKGLNLQRNSVSTRLTQMAKAGEIKKATRGYEAK